MALMDDELVFEVQRLYPRIYMACHLEHVRSRSTKWNLSSRDAAILAHLDVDEASSPRSLAAHLGVVASTLSATLGRLERLGYISSVAVHEDRRRRQIFLTPRGAEAIVGTSVLEGRKVKQMLKRLTGEEVGAALAGLRLPARAASELAEVGEE